MGTTCAVMEYTHRLFEVDAGALYDLVSARLGRSLTRKLRKRLEYDCSKPPSL